MEERRHPVVENESVNASQKQEHATLVPVEHLLEAEVPIPSDTILKSLVKHKVTRGIHVAPIDLQNNTKIILATRSHKKLKGKE